MIRFLLKSVLNALLVGYFCSLYFCSSFCSSLFLKNFKPSLSFSNFPFLNQFISSFETGKHRCFLCKENTGDIVKCSEKKCGKFYHLKCLLDQNYPHKILNEEQKKFKCPLHFCLTCYNEHLEDCVIRTVKKPLLTCIKCPTAYHYLNECIAAGSYFVDSDHIVCPEHVEKTEIKKNGKTTSQHVNVNWCFYCNAGGELICCEKCPAARHLSVLLFFCF